LPDWLRISQIRLFFRGVKNIVWLFAFFYSILTSHFKKTENDTKIETKEIGLIIVHITNTNKPKWSHKKCSI